MCRKRVVCVFSVEVIYELESKRRVRWSMWDVLEDVGICTEMKRFWMKDGECEGWWLEWSEEIKQQQRDQEFYTSFCFSFAPQPTLTLMLRHFEAKNTFSVCTRCTRCIISPFPFFTAPTIDILFRLFFFFLFFLAPKYASLYDQKWRRWLQCPKWTHERSAVWWRQFVHSDRVQGSQSKCNLSLLNWRTNLCLSCKKKKTQTAYEDD